MPIRRPGEARRRVVVALVLTLLSGACAAWRPPSASVAGPAYQVTVGAGSLARLQSVVSFPFPDDLPLAAEHRLADGNGGRLPLQVDPQRTAWFVLDRLASGESRTYRIEAAPAAATPGVEARRAAGAVTFVAGGRPSRSSPAARM